MRYSLEHKDKSYQRVLSSASRMIRSKGIDSISIGGVMADAGLTQGAFYAHFDSKEDLAIQAVKSALDDSINGARERIRLGMAEGHSATRAFIDFYLSEAHMESPWRGCALASITQEVGRGSPALRNALVGKFEQVTQAMAPHMPGANPDEQFARAEVLYSAVVGVLSLGRIPVERTGRMAYLARCRTQLLSLFGERSESAPQ